MYICGSQSLLITDIRLPSLASESYHSVFTSEKIQIIINISLGMVPSYGKVFGSLSTFPCLASPRLYYSIRLKMDPSTGCAHPDGRSWECLKLSNHEKGAGTRENTISCCSTYSRVHT